MKSASAYVFYHANLIEEKQHVIPNCVGAGVCHRNGWEACKVKIIPFSKVRHGLIEDDLRLRKIAIFEEVFRQIVSMNSSEFAISKPAPIPRAGAKILNNTTAELHVRKGYRPTAFGNPLANHESSGIHDAGNAFDHVPIGIIVLMNGCKFLIHLEMDALVEKRGVFPEARVETGYGLLDQSPAVVLVPVRADELKKQTSRWIFEFRSVCCRDGLESRKSRRSLSLIFVGNKLGAFLHQRCEARLLVDGNLPCEPLDLSLTNIGLPRRDQPSPNNRGKSDGRNGKHSKGRNSLNSLQQIRACACLNHPSSQKRSASREEYGTSDGHTKPSILTLVSGSAVIVPFGHNPSPTSTSRSYNFDRASSTGRRP